MGRNRGNRHCVRTTVQRDAPQSDTPQSDTPQSDTRLSRIESEGMPREPRASGLFDRLQPWPLLRQRLFDAKLIQHPTDRVVDHFFNGFWLLVEGR